MSDPTAIPPQTLVEHAQFVRRIAVAILHDDASADDAAQETLARGLVRGPAAPAARTSWLGAVARNVARGIRRGSSRSAAREQAIARPEATASVADLAVRAETIRAVAEAVVALDEPFRSAVILCHYEGLTRREIATRTGESAEAVKKRLQRAHAQLRGRLERLHPGGEGKWRSALAAFAGTAATNVGAGAATTAASSAASASSTVAAAAKSAAGEVVMGTTAKIGIAAAAVLVLGVGGWLAFGRDRDEMPAGSSSPPAAATSDPASSKRPPMLAAQGKPTPPQTAPSAPSSEAPSALKPAEVREPTEEQIRAFTDPTQFDVIRGVVLGTKGPIEGVSVSASPREISAQRTTWIMEHMGSMTRVKPGGARSDVNGEFQIENMAADQCDVTVELAGATTRLFRVRDMRVLTASKEWETKKPRIVAVFGDGEVKGTLFDRSGAKVPARMVRLAYRAPVAGSAVPVKPVGPPAAPRPSELLETLTDTEGEFRFTRVRSASWDLMAALDVTLDQKGADVRSASVLLRPGESTRVDLGGPKAEPLWTGVIRFSTGTPVRGSRLLRLSDAEHAVQLWVKVGDEGRVTHRLPPGTYEVSLADASGSALPSAVPPLVVGEQDGERDLVIPGARVTGAVHAFAVRKGEQRRVVGIFDVKALRVPDVGASAIAVKTQLDGGFEFLGLPAGRWRLEATAMLNNAVVSSTQEIDITDRDVDGVVLEVGKP